MSGITQEDREAATEFWAAEGPFRMGLNATLAKAFATVRIQARNAALEEARPLIEMLADDLEAEMKDRYCLGDGTPHPALKRKYDRDMVPVNEARSFLSTQDTPDMRATNT
jgi:hypothetical protein